MISLKRSTVGAVAIGLLSLSIYAVDAPSAEKVDSLQQADSVLVPQTTCPVMGGDIDKELYADYEGNRAYFCCGMCSATFKKDPVKYIEKLKGMGQGVEKVSLNIEKKKSK